MTYYVPTLIICYRLVALDRSQPEAVLLHKGDGHPVNVCCGH